MNVYLGSRVKDTRSEGLDSLREAEEIADAIIEDCVSGRISYRTAVSRMNLLELVATKKFAGERERKARQIIDRKREELIQECKQ